MANGSPDSSPLAEEIARLTAQAAALTALVKRVDTAKQDNVWFLDKKVIATCLRRARADAAVGQKVVAGFLQCAESALAAWEGGRNPPPLKYILRLAVLYGVPVSYLCGHDNGVKEQT
ncbi:unnamed protein product [marine sediment metagenome]|uniref:HTH cro/C1-type domain-containing protein n=1 Tax=marine sediment metagenome TaxID=412755 RepID=X0SC68_9ZZZZ